MEMSLVYGYEINRIKAYSSELCDSTAAGRKKITEK